MSGPKIKFHVYIHPGAFGWKKANHNNNNNNNKEGKHMSGTKIKIHAKIDFKQILGSTLVSIVFIYILV